MKNNGNIKNVKDKCFKKKMNMNFIKKQVNKKFKKKELINNNNMRKNIDDEVKKMM